MIDPTCGTCMERILDLEPEAHEAHCAVPHEAGDHLTAVAQRFVNLMWEKKQERTTADVDWRDWMEGR